VGQLKAAVAALNADPPASSSGIIRIEVCSIKISSVPCVQVVYMWLALRSNVT
jgi:hypothetical protein